MDRPGADTARLRRVEQIHPYPGIAALLPTVGTVLVIGAGCAGPSQGCGRILGLSWMGAMGRISYSWYLWHWPVLVLAPVLVGHPLGPAGPVDCGSGFQRWRCSLRFIENPLRFSPRIRNSPRNSLALGGAVTAAAVVVGLVLPVWLPNPVGRGPAVRRSPSLHSRPHPARAWRSTTQR